MALVAAIAAFVVVGIVLAIIQGSLAEVGIFRLNAVPPYRTMFTLLRVAISLFAAWTAYGMVG